MFLLVVLKLTLPMKNFSLSTRMELQKFIGSFCLDQKIDLLNGKLSVFPLTGMISPPGSERLTVICMDVVSVITITRLLCISEFNSPIPAMIEKTALNVLISDSKSVIQLIQIILSAPYFRHASRSCFSCAAAGHWEWERSKKYREEGIVLVPVFAIAEDCQHSSGIHIVPSECGSHPVSF